MSEVQFQFIRPWVLQTPYVYRYLEREWVAEFFTRGILMLSSFAKFRENPDERTGDTNEGDGILVGTSSNQTVYAVMNEIPHAYVLSTSLLLSKKVANDLKKDACFRIKDAVAFSAAIANQLPGCKGGTEGMCNYTRHGSVHANMREIPIGSGPMPSLNEVLGSIEQAAGASLIFAKSLKYSDQVEYRFAWGAVAPLQMSIKITCLQAVEFCGKVEIPEE